MARTIQTCDTGTRLLTALQALQAGIVTEPDTEIFDLQRLLLSDLLNADNLAGSFLELPQLTQKVPKPEKSNKN